MNGRSERVLLETDRYRIVGDLMLPRNGYRSRLSDYLNSSDRDFISLTGVTLQAIDEHGRPGEPAPCEFVTVARQHIVLATVVATEPAAVNGDG
ncbi:MAG: hypothetical protein M3155_02355 [Actinomycetota bacterium]|nr:hypothetical protein [Actinomycetota bacterium]